tara:strand:+ start:422 stop:646 length:225 start_codon:yes stop_codon:yes gene_type:complete
LYIILKLEYRCVVSKYEIKPLVANKMATGPELWAGSGWSMNNAARNMNTYVVTPGALADEGYGRREKNIKGAEK